MKRFFLSGAKLWNASRLFALLVAVCWVHNLYAVESIHSVKVDGISYNLYDDDHTACVIKGSSIYDGVLSIPNEVVYNGTTYIVTSIYGEAFYHRLDLTELIIGNNVTTIGGGAFEECSNLTKLTISNSVITISDYAFRNCIGLTELTIPNNVTTIGYYAFMGCTGLTEITIPASVTTIRKGVFDSCSGLEKIVVEEGNPCYDSRDNCNAIIDKEFEEYDNDYVYLHTGCKNTHIPNSVTAISSYAFSGCTGLTGINIPTSVTSIGTRAFRNCWGLMKLTIPNSVTNIGDEAFYDCKGLTELIIGNSVTNIASEAFEYCNSLTSVTSLNTVPPIIMPSTFDFSVEQKATLHVPAGCKDVYQHADYWNNFYNILDDAPLTSIEEISVDMQSNNEIYTVNGVKLNITNISELPKGIYIINGKKTIIK